MDFYSTTLPSLSPRTRRAAFTLVELLVVMAIIIIMTALVVPAFTSIGAAGDFGSAAADIGSTMEQARAYAMANNTYVYVGIGEYLVTESPSTSPRTVGTGQVVLAIVATRDGTSGYDVNNPASTWSSAYQNAQSGAPFLTAIDKLHVYNNVHLADFPIAGTPPSGNMSRPVLASQQYCLGDSSAVSATPLSWPLGKALNAGQYNFTKVIQIDPEGVARIQTPTSADSITSYLEIDLQPTHGNIAPALPANENVGNQAAVQIDCMTGAATVYRP